jgi:23S rRNA (cytosine1962-C5)-methyltransferase
MTDQINILTSDNWIDYELLDSGDGQKLEKFGEYLFVRPEVQAIRVGRKVGDTGSS